MFNDEVKRTIQKQQTECETYTAYLVTTNTETGTITHKTLKEYGCLNMVPNQRQR